ncbi:MAG: hypothetical protein GXO76_10675 [Calditrichaeota bacterium]|nr:hypothetical protein [Calditrichota bacterium]
MIIPKIGFLFKKTAYLFAILLFLSQIFILPVSLPSLVLCVGDDHVALELKSSQTRSVANSNAITAQENARTGFHNDACIDISLFQYSQDLFANRYPLAVQSVRLVQKSSTAPPVRPPQLFAGLHLLRPSFSLQNAENHVVLLI